MTIVFLVIFIGLVFEYINGFHDTANSIAMVVSTKVLSPREAVVLAAVTNLLGAMSGTAVAKTIAGGLVEGNIVTSEVLICALLGAIIWNLITWWFGLPSSSSHALIGGLCGGALAAAGGHWDVIIWSQPSAVHWWEGKGLLWKVIVPMIVSPLCGFVVGFLMMALLYICLQKGRPTVINKIFGKIQMFSAASMGFMHGTNDAQKTMGIIALALVAGTSAGAFDHLPSWLQFLHTPAPEKGKSVEIAFWIKAMCALTMAAGTAAGGWRIIKTLGTKVVKLQPINGFAIDTTSSLVIFTATQFGIPVSTTHNVSAAVMGVGAAKRFNSIRWTTVETMVWAWILTIPISGAFAFVLTEVVRMIKRG